MVIRSIAEFGPTAELPARVFALLNGANPEAILFWAQSICHQLSYSMFHNESRFAQSTLDQTKALCEPFTFARAAGVTGEQFPESVTDAAVHFKKTVEDIEYLRFAASIQKAHQEERPIRTMQSRESFGSDKARRVFVIYGRDERLRSGMFDFLRAIGLDPKKWTQITHLTGEASPHISDILEAGFREVQAVIALLTPDDLAMLREDLVAENDPQDEKTLTGQPRPNVLFEAGMAFASHPKQTVLVQIGKVRQISDLSGRHVVMMDNSVAKRQDLANRLKSAGCPVDLIGIDWHSAGDFTQPLNPRYAAANVGQGRNAAQEDQVLVIFSQTVIMPDALGTPMECCLVKAVNKGKRPVTIAGLGLELSEGSTFNPSRLECYSSEMPAKLFESDGLSAWMIKSEVPMEKVKWAFARTNDGTVYKSKPIG